MRVFPSVTGFLLAFAAPAAAQVAAFAYDPARAPVGVAHEYVKSNLDGSHQIRVVSRLTGPDRLEVLKLEPENGAAAFVRARMHWETATADRLESEVLFPDGTRRPQATLTLDPGTRRVDVEVFGTRDTLTVGALPAHVYNFDLLSLAAALPHLSDPGAGFTIGIVNPRFMPQPPLLRYDGEARVEPDGVEERAGVPARRYTIDGAGLTGARLWTAEDDGRLLAIESDVPDNPGWSTFRLELLSRTPMTDGEWTAFVESEVAALPAAPDGSGSPQ